MTTFQSAWELVASIEGWMAPGQARALFEAAAQVQNLLGHVIAADPY